MGCDKWVTEKINQDAKEAEEAKATAGPMHVHQVHPLPEKVKEVIKNVKNVPVKRR